MRRWMSAQPHLKGIQTTYLRYYIFDTENERETTKMKPLEIDDFMKQFGLSLVDECNWIYCDYRRCGAYRTETSC